MNDQSQISNQPQMMNQSQVMNKSQMMNQSQVMSQSQMMVRSYGMWPPPPQPPQPSMDPMKFLKPGFVASKQSKPPGRSNWKGKKGADKRKDLRRKETVVAGSGPAGGYKPPTLHELQSQNRLKARRFYPKKKFNNNNNRVAPYAPRNTTSFIIRAKKSGGIASLVSPCPVTPAVLPTPIFSPSREVLVDMAKEEWGVDGYGSMKGLIRLRSEAHEDEEEEEGGSSESDVEEHVEVERRLDHDLSRFEMIYPNSGVDYNNVLENRVDDQDTHIAQLEEENMTLKERLFLMERELGDLRRRMQCLERQGRPVDEINEEVVENVSENESEGRGDVQPAAEENNEEEVVEYVTGNDEGGSKEENNDDAASENEGVGDVCMEEFVATAEEDEAKDEEGAESAYSEKSIGDGDLSSGPALMEREEEQVLVLRILPSFGSTNS